MEKVCRTGHSKDPSQPPHLAEARGRRGALVPPVALEHPETAKTGAVVPSQLGGLLCSLRLEISDRADDPTALLRTASTGDTSTLNPLLEPPEPP